RYPAQSVKGPAGCEGVPVPPVWAAEFAWRPKQSRSRFRRASKRERGFGWRGRDRPVTTAGKEESSISKTRSKRKRIFNPTGSDLLVTRQFCLRGRAPGPAL